MSNSALPEEDISRRSIDNSVKQTDTPSMHDYSSLLEALNEPEAEQNMSTNDRIQFRSGFLGASLNSSSHNSILFGTASAAIHADDHPSSKDDEQPVSTLTPHQSEYDMNKTAPDQPPTLYGSFRFERPKLPRQLGTKKMRRVFRETKFHDPVARNLALRPVSSCQGILDLNEGTEVTTDHYQVFRPTISKKYHKQ